ncbi:MAG: thiamine pyrophosphate-binding protein [Gemmatimonadota bacterium]
MTGADLACRALERLGVTHVFGLPGTQNVPLFEALRGAAFRTVVPTHEMGAAFMAAGYSRASGRVGVLTTIPGPGFTYALTGLAEARLDSVPILYLVGQPARGPGKRFQLQAIDQAAIAAPLIKARLDVSRIEDFPRAVAEGHRLALAGEPGPVMVHYDPALLGAETTAAVPAEAPGAGDGASGIEGITETLELLGRAKRVVILAGQGANGAGDLVRLLAERLGAAVITTTSARGVVAEDHPLVVQTDLRGAGGVNELVAASDLVLALGVKFSHNGALGFQLRLPEGRLVHVDESPESLGANYPARLPIRANVGAWIEELIHRAPAAPVGPGWAPDELDARRARLAQSSVFPVEPRVAGAEPAAFFAALRTALPRETCLVTDSGLHEMLARRHFPVLAARGLIVPTDFQSMGFGLPAAIGARLAAPERPVVLVTGDGGLAMCGLELLTAVKERVTLPILVLNDGRYGLIRLDQIRQYGHAFGVDLPALDFAALAEATGAGYAAPDEDLAQAIRRALDAPGPTVIEVPVGDSSAMRRARAGAQARNAGRKLLPRWLIDRLKQLR